MWSVGWMDARCSVFASVCEERMNQPILHENPLFLSRKRRLFVLFGSVHIRGYLRP